MSRVFNRATFPVLKLNSKYTLDRTDEEAEIFYHENIQAMQSTSSYYTFIVGYFNANIGHKKYDSEIYLGDYGYGNVMKEEICYSLYNILYAIS